ncbi:unnamed protein product [Brassica rapa]|uniref:Uncharacterized protein n=1 Tax=Brassica campestris TaxID=3711 RepID=A0A8D9HL98_BRACM|nr:unnamed protein product [Brassica rapa]
MQTVEEIYKVASIAFSPNVSAQIFMGLMVSPPKPGDISYDQFVRESKGILESLRRRARIMTDGFNSCKNVVCNFTEGAIYHRKQSKQRNKLGKPQESPLFLALDLDRKKGCFI